MPQNPPVALWLQMLDPDTAVREKAIRADQRRLDLRELQATVKDLRWLVDRIIPDEDEIAKDPGTVVVSVDTLDQLRRHTRHLITRSERSIQRLEAEAA